MAERIGAYSPETAKMILEVVNYLKKNGCVTSKGDRGLPVFEPTREHIFKTTGTITARSGTNAGMGPAVRQWIPGDAGTDDTIEEFSDESVFLYNLGTCDIESDNYVIAIRECGSGKWVITKTYEQYVTDVYIESNQFKKKIGCGTPEVIFDITTECP